MTYAHTDYILRRNRTEFGWRHISETQEYGTYIYEQRKGVNGYTEIILESFVTNIIYVYAWKIYILCRN